MRCNSVPGCWFFEVEYFSFCLGLFHALEAGYFDSFETDLDVGSFRSSVEFSVPNLPLIERPTPRTNLRISSFFPHVILRNHRGHTWSELKDLLIL